MRTMSMLLSLRTFSNSAILFCMPFILICSMLSLLFLVCFVLDCLSVVVFRVRRMLLCIDGLCPGSEVREVACSCVGRECDIIGEFD